MKLGHFIYIAAIIFLLFISSHHTFATEKGDPMIPIKTRQVLEKIKEEINQEYGFHDGTPRINYGPCGVFAHIFFKKWNALFDQKVHICFVLTKDRDECDHVLVRLPSGELYDGGIGIHSGNEYLPEFIIEDMVDYDENLLEKWSYGLDRTYPRFCPHFDRKVVEHIVHSNLEKLLNND